MSTATPVIVERKTLDYFRRECLRFRRMWDDVAFWADDARQRNAIAGLTLVFLNLELDAGKPSEDAETIFYATTDEYSRRKAHIDVSRIFGRRVTD